MEITRILSASVLAGAMLLSGTACSGVDTGKKTETAASSAPSDSNQVKATVSAAPVESPTVSDSGSVSVPAQTSGAAGDQTATRNIVSVISGYYNFVGSAGSLAKVRQARSKYAGRATLTDAELADLVAGFPEGFQFFDTSSPQHINNAYNQLYARATQSDRTPGAKVVVPPEAVAIKGDTATADSSEVKVTLNGVIHSATETPYFELAQINLVKTQEGSWVIVAETPRQTIP